ncbi:glycosyltransferase family 8 protein [Pelagicoccus albus]|uniref:Glycosyltransferase family 8 protein n=1 Tax=Pelagicoccus albus TaxID=415222 RepID=A0A7X1B7F0_9BACT|nr:glycosyltransferase family 8 protein [Pelagicoccus albus]MBC2606932.1 glycosyltransferase family 8 protein [Pelagicoccus albus]
MGINVACACDNSFAMPLAVMVRSILDTLSCSEKIELFVLDGGVSPENKKKVLSSWEAHRVDVNWLSPELSDISGLRVSGHVNLLTYFRILLPRMLPERVERVIYLDCDMVVRKDLSVLWDTPLGDYALCAVQDMTVPVMNASEGLENYEMCRPFLSLDVPLNTYRELSISPTCKYFNAGLLFINLKMWRKERIAERVLSYLRNYNERIQFWDQDGLNAVLYNQWGELDLRWNQIPHIYRYPSWRHSPFDEVDFELARNEPWIIHYAASDKPWNPRSEHPLKGEFYETLKGTQWSDWLP